MSERPQLFGKTLFVDLMMGTLVVVTALFMAARASEKEDEKRRASLATEGVLAVVLTWPDASADDVDLYVRDPAGRVVYFGNKTEGLLHLERDDQGKTNDVDGLQKVLRNEERAVLRGTLAGEYVVGAHMYRKFSQGPVPVTVRLVSLRGEDAVLLSRDRVLRSQGDEATAFRFTLGADGRMRSSSDLRYRFVGAATSTVEGP